MQFTEIRQTIIFHASPEQVYTAIMDSAIHSDFTKATAEIGKNEGEDYSAWDGYITGVILQLEPYHRIIKTWIADESEWPEGHSSEVMFEFNPVDEGTEMVFLHTGVPENLSEQLKQGWIDFYWEPMSTYFDNQKNTQA